MNDLIEGYQDGRDKNAPEAGENRSKLYKHGFLNGRDDMKGRPRKPAHEIRKDYNDIVEEEM